MNLPGKLKGKEKELAAGARAKGFGIWPTLSEPTQVRIDALLESGAEFDKQKVLSNLSAYYAKAA